MNTSLRSDVSLREFNTLRVEAHATQFARVGSLADLEALRSLPQWEATPRLILGGGSNLLLTGDVNGLVIRVEIMGRELVRQDTSAWYVRAGAGENWNDFVQFTLQSGWPGLENLISIPGSVGASPIQNIGAYGVELKDRFYQAEVFDLRTGLVSTMDAQACRFGYRDSVFKNGLFGKVVVLSVTFRLPKIWRSALDYGELRARLRTRGITDPTPHDVAEVVAAIRSEKLPDPSLIGNAGSFFKNPIVSSVQYEQLRDRYPLMVSYLQRDGRYKLAAAWLIEQCGWKGRTIGRAGVHEQQALVLINRGGATGEDFVTLARAILDSVRARFGVILETEPVIV